MQVNLYPSHPLDGGPSMQRYWRETRKAVDDSKVPIEFACPFGEPSESYDRPRRIRRAFARYVEYPIRARLFPPADLGHLLDHSSAHILPHLPKAMKSIVTVHDLIPLRFPGELTNAQTSRFRRVVAKIAEADAIIAVSETTASEVTSLLGIPQRKVRVLFGGCSSGHVSEETRLRIRNRLSILKESCDLVMLSIGSTLKRKNLEIMAPALAAAAKKSNRSYGLVRVGKALPEGLRAGLESCLGDSRFTELGFLSDEELTALYLEVDFVFIPSLYEGFGLPVLEAMANGCAVVAADATSLPEVGADCVIYFDPRCPESAAEAISRLSEGGLVDSLIEKGKERAFRYSWKNHAKNLYEIYKSLT